MKKAIDKYGNNNKPNIMPCGVPGKILVQLLQVIPILIPILMLGNLI